MNANDPEQWNTRVRSWDRSRLYHLYEWGLLLQEVYGYKLFYLYQGEGIFPLVLVPSPIFGNRLISLPFADYGGPGVCPPDVAVKLIARCQEIAHKLKVGFVEVRCPDPKYFAAFEEQGFIRREEYLTFVLPLNRSIEELWRGIGDKNRNMVRKAERSEVHIVPAENKQALKAFYLLYRKTMKKLGSPPQPYRFFEKMWELFYPENLMLSLANHKGQYVAGGLFLLYDGVIHHAYSCSLKDYLALAPNDLIQWFTIKWGQEHGFRYLDFGRTRADEGTVLFKRRWGGEVIRMPYFYQFYRKELKERQEIKYRRLSSLWAKYVPEFIAARIGPWLIKQVG